MSEKEAKGIASNIFIAYISILGVVLAISAIILAIVQISNSRLNITKLVFTRTLFMPLVYFGLINIILIGLSQLCYKPEDNTFYSNYYIQFIIASVYTFICFILLTFIVFFKTFRYLDFNNVVDDYLKDMILKVELNYDTKYLSTHGREVYSEVTKVISNEDNVMLAKLLQAINNISKINPNTTFLFSLENKIAEWHFTAYSENKTDIWSTLVSSWRELRTNTVTSGNENTKYYYSSTPSRVLNLITKNKEQAAFYYALHLKELIVYSPRPNSDNILLNSSYQHVVYYLKDLVELINTLIQQSEIGALKKAYNQFIQVIDNYEYELKRNNSSENRNHNSKDSEERTIFLSKAYHASLSIFAQFVYKVQFYQEKTKYNQEIYEILSKLFYERNHSLKIDEITVLQKNEAVDWEAWIWNIEDREDGRSYLLLRKEDVLSFGLLNLYIKFPHLKPSTSNNHLTENFDWLKKNKGEAIKSLGDISATDLDKRINTFENVLIDLQHQSDERRKRRIIDSPKSAEKIKAFRELMSNQWSESRNIYKIFEYYQAIDVNPDEYLLQIGTPRINFIEGRALFIDGDEYVPISGIDWGKVVNKEVENALVYSISKEDIKIRNANNIVEAFNNVTGLISQPDEKHLVAFLPFDKKYKWQVELVNSGKYQSFDERSNKYPFPAMGIYDDKIIVVSISKNSSNTEVIILNLPDAINYQQRIQEHFVNNQLEVTVLLHEDDQFKNPSDIDELISPENSIIIVQEIMNFKIVDTKSIFIYEVGSS